MAYLGCTHSGSYIFSLQARVLLLHTSYAPEEFVYLLGANCHSRFGFELDYCVHGLECANTLASSKWPEARCLLRRVHDQMEEAALMKPTTF